MMAGGMNMRMVLKFGGSSLATPQRIHHAAALTAASARDGAQVIVVVSAQGDTTDGMICRAKAIAPCPDSREMDAYLCAGEQMSAALMAMALHRLCVPAVSFTGWQAGVHTDSCFGSARIQTVAPDKILAALDAGKIAVVAGFQGVDEDGNLTTLGRGGSDTTAVALAAALDAQVCRIYTDVDGVYDQDPRKYPQARRFRRIGYDNMLALARCGAQVLHDRCVELARDNGIRLEVRSSFTDAPGTIVG